MSAAAAGRQLFIYWRTSLGVLPAAVAAVRQWQAALRHGHPGLDMRLFVRREAQHATLMEVYALPGSTLGVDETVQAMLVQQGDAVTLPMRLGARHVEAFEPAD